MNDFQNQLGQFEQEKSEYEAHQQSQFEEAHSSNHLLKEEVS